MKAEGQQHLPYQPLLLPRGTNSLESLSQGWLAGLGPGSKGSWTLFFFFLSFLIPPYQFLMTFNVYFFLITPSSIVRCVKTMNSPAYSLLYQQGHKGECLADRPSNGC